MNKGVDARAGGVVAAKRRVDAAGGLMPGHEVARIDVAAVIDENVAVSAPGVDAVARGAAGRVVDRDRAAGEIARGVADGDGAADRGGADAGRAIARDGDVVVGAAKNRDRAA